LYLDLFEQPGGKQCFRILLAQAVDEEMMDRVRVGIVGLGRIAPAHIRAVKACADLAELVAVVSRRREAAQVAAKQHGVPTVYGSLEDALAARTLDAVVLCSPNHLHAAQAIAAAKAGCHVLVEKPLSNTLAEADAMIAAATRSGAVLMVAQCRRFTRAAQEAKARLAAMGPVVSIVHTLAVRFPGVLTDWWPSAGKTGGLALGLNGPHVVDTIVWLMGKNPLRVQATSARHNPGWEGEDEAALLLDFPDGGIGVGHLSFNANPGFNERGIVAARGTMRMTDDTRLVVNGETVVDETYGPYLQGGPNFDAQMREFLTAIREGRPPLASAAEIRIVVEVLEAARRAIAIGRPIPLPL
jgi:predicted dehydrogenase